MHGAGVEDLVLRRGRGVFVRPHRRRSLSEVPLMVRIELRAASGAAEIIGLALVLGAVRRIGLDRHAADRVLDRGSLGNRGMPHQRLPHQRSSPCAKTMPEAGSSPYASWMVRGTIDTLPSAPMPRAADALLQKS